MTSRTEPAGRGMSKKGARSSLDRLQVGIGILLVLCGTAGGYLLATDGSLWNLALSHALGLVVVVLVDLTVGLLSLFSYRRIYVPSLAAAVLGIVLQLGDILTAPQYHMTVQYFASYLFGLWPFDLMLAVQLAVLVLGVAGRRHALYLARRRSRRGTELEYSRRGFLKSMGVFGVLVGFVAVISSVKLPVSSPTTTTTTSQGGFPAGAIARKSSLAVGTPVYFDYPSGYPNMLVLQADGSLLAFSMLCTHVCCTLQYVPALKELGCPCHGSIFSSTGKVVQGPAGSDLPQVTLRVDSNGFIFPTGIPDPGPCLP
ncbi:MAG: Rieske 2Fe-2S domain-containing protein [Nitrososphaerota archaeon]|nr:Rieske 2Fe-2S domain-containing protein [Nitrososphaerota archaeon]MDG7022892.1 Rieske 2Fe-2S domain-containing protein [Nitrososphaerota archaeon]